MKRKTRERLPSLVSIMSRAVRDKGFMTHLAMRMQAWTVRMKPGRLRWYCFAFFLVAGLGETWLFTSGFGLSRETPDFSLIRPVVTQGGLGHQHGAVATSFCRSWDSIMTDPIVKRNWDSLLLERPELAETLKKLKEMDSTAWKW
jgi:hypothetical protein